MDNSSGIIDHRLWGVVQSYAPAWTCPEFGEGPTPSLYAFSYLPITDHR